MKRGCALGVASLSLVIVWWRWRVQSSVEIADLNFFNYDLYSYYYPTVRFGFEELRRGHLPLWNPYQLAGEPFFANQQHGLLYPLNVLFLFLAPAVAFKWTAILHYGVALLFAGYLGSVMGLSRGAASMVAVTFAFSGYMQNLLYLRTWLNGAVWLPLELALAIRLFRDAPRGIPTLLLAGALACQYLGGYPMHSLFAAYTLGLFAVWQSVRLARRRLWRRAVFGSAALAIAAALAASLSAVQLLPMIEMTSLSPRRLGSLHPMAVNLVPSYGVALLRSLFHPAPLTAAYLGAAVFPLTLCSFLNSRLRAMATGFVALAVLSAALAASTATPLYAFYGYLPTSNWFRFPHEFVYLVTFALACAAGIGVDALRNLSHRSHTMMAAILAIGALVGAFAIHLFSFVPAWHDTVSAGLMSLAIPALLLAAGMRRVGICVAIIATWADLSLAAHHRFIIPDVGAETFEPPAALTQFLLGQQGHRRIYLHTPPLRAPVAKIGMRYHLFNIADHESLLPTRYAEYGAWMENGTAPSPIRLAQGGIFLDPHRKRMQLLNLLGVGYLVAFDQSPFADAAEAVRYPTVFAEDSTQVHANSDALPRAFVVGHTEVSEPPLILSKLSNATFDPLQTALVETSAAVLPTGVSRLAEIRDYQAERVVIETDGDTPGLLILTDQYYPGWRATLDGQPVQIYCADYIFRGVPVPPGRHTVEFSYRPAPFIIGAWITVLTLIAILVAVGWALWRWARRAAPPLMPAGRGAAP